MHPLLISALLPLAAVPPLAAQNTCWRPRVPEACRHYVVTDFALGYWLNPTSARFDRDRSRVVLNGSFGYQRAVGTRDAVGATLDVTYYNRRERYAAIDWLYPAVAAQAMVRWDHWVADQVALRVAAGTPLGGARRDATIASPGLNLELGARWHGRLGGFVRMERQRLDDRIFAYPAVPGMQYPLGNVGTLQHNTALARTDWYAGLSTHGWMGATSFLGVTLLALASAFGYSS